MLAPRFALLPLAFLALTPACGGDSGDDGNASAESTDTDPGSSTGLDDGDDPTGPMTGVESSGVTGVESSGVTVADTTDGPSDSSGAAESTDESGTMPVACQVWEITYDLTGSEFEISDTPFNGAGDQTNVVGEPYDQDDHIGPGSIALRFHDIDGAPGGQAFVSSYDMDLNFVVGDIVMVTTDLVVSAGPSECGLTSGALGGTTVAWVPAEMADVHTEGSIVCAGLACSAGGFRDGVPMPVDDIAPQAVNPFVFSTELDTFTMAQVVIAMDDQSTSSWTFTGAEVSRELVDAPACMCP